MSREMPKSDGQIFIAYYRFAATRDFPEQTRQGVRSRIYEEAEASAEFWGKRKGIEAAWVEHRYDIIVAGKAPTIRDQDGSMPRFTAHNGTIKTDEHGRWLDG